MLAKYHPLWMNIHFNHPNEITPEVVARLRPAGPRRHPARQPVGAAGRRQRLRPHHAGARAPAGREPRPAVLHLPVRPRRGLRPLPHAGRQGHRDHGGPARPHVSGYAVPTYVVDAPGGGGKIPVMPNYLISYSDHKVVLRNYEGYITTYEEPVQYTPHDKANCTLLPAPAPGAGPGRSRRAARGRPTVDRAGRLRADAPSRQRVRAPAAGSEPSGCPTGSARSKERPASRCPRSSRARTARHRRWTLAARRQAGRHAGRRPRSPPDRPRRGAAPAEPEFVYGPGEEPRPREGEPTGWHDGDLLSSRPRRRPVVACRRRPPFVPGLEPRGSS